MDYSIDQKCFYTSDFSILLQTDFSPGDQETIYPEGESEKLNLFYYNVEDLFDRIISPKQYDTEFSQEGSVG